jgi:hypothetical protein
LGFSLDYSKAVFTVTAKFIAKNGYWPEWVKIKEKRGTFYVTAI